MTRMYRQQRGVSLKSRPIAGRTHSARGRRRKPSVVHSAPVQRSSVCTRTRPKRLKDSQTTELRASSCAAAVRPKLEETQADIPVLTEQLKSYQSWVTNDKWEELNKVAKNAMRDRKVFMMRGDEYPAVQEALFDRGWIEKHEAHKILEPSLIENPEDTEFSKLKRQILHKLVELHSVDFIWMSECSLQKSSWSLSNKEVIINRFRRSPFTTKDGLTACLTQMHWFTEPGVSLTRFPRSYNITNSDGLEEFIEDFRITACISILKWLSNTVETSGVHSLISSNGTVPISAIEFALSRLNEYISFYTHKDIDEPGQSRVACCTHDWDEFLTHHYLLVSKNGKFNREIYPMYTKIRRLNRSAVIALASIPKYKPQVHIDGVLNIWIVKPGASCRGRGIQLMNNINDILDFTNKPLGKKAKYVVQKYIENPLIIYNTKFDIRQWFLITNCEPLTIWIYKDCYLRFSSQLFNLADYHESVHLTNNAVQSKYTNNRQRDKALPDDNMWDCRTFKAYLRQIGKHDIWDSRIYPGIKQCLIGALLACQDSMHKRESSFELYGADFMLSDDFTPWLIEINSNPDLEPTTTVTKRLCPQCLKDVIKVVLDRRENPEADTGAFELAYRQCLPKATPYCGLSLRICGKKLKVTEKNKNNSANLELIKIKLLRL